MNPYLEHPTLWREVHSLLIVAIFDALNPQVRPKYRVAIEQRVYKASGEDSLLVGIPDVAVQKTQIEKKSETGNIAVASLAGDKEPIVDLQELINGIYDRASYDLVIDYSQEAVPELSEEDKIWVDEVLKEQKLR
jgi:hypothetical protein